MKVPDGSPNLARRLGVAALTVAGLTVVAALTMAVLSALGWGQCPAVHYPVYFVGLSVSVIVFFLSRQSTLKSGAVSNLGLAYEVSVAFGVAVLEGSTPASHGGTAGLSWVSVIIVLFPILVPASPGRTFLAGLAAATAGAAGHLAFVPAVHLNSR